MTRGEKLSGSTLALLGAGAIGVIWYTQHKMTAPSVQGLNRQMRPWYGFRGLDGIRFMAAGQQSQRGGLAGSWPRGSDWATGLAERFSFYGNRAPYNPFGSWGMGLIDRNPHLTINDGQANLPFYSAGMPGKRGLAHLNGSPHRPGARQLGRATSEELGIELGMPGHAPWAAPLDVRQHKGFGGSPPIPGRHPLDGSFHAHRSLHGSFERFPHMHNKLTLHGLDGLDAIINPSDEFVSTTTAMGAWPATGTSGSTDLMAQLPADQQAQVAQLVAGGAQLVDAIAHVVSGQPVVAAKPVSPVTASSIPIAILGLAAYYVISKRR